MPHIVLVGHISVGFHAAGPFPDYEACESFIDRCLELPEHGQIFELLPPEDHATRLRPPEELVSVQLDRLLDCYHRETGDAPGSIMLPRGIFARLLQEIPAMNDDVAPYRYRDVKLVVSDPIPETPCAS